MNNIQMVDLVGQYRKIKAEIDGAILETIESGAFINGPAVERFRAELSEYISVPHVVTCANGTDALQVALMALGLQPGDEVITSNFSFIAAVEVIALLRLKPVLVDVDPYSFNMDPDRLRKAIGPKTKAVIPVHLFGQPAPMEEIMSIGREYGLHIIEDSAQALGAFYKFSSGRLQRAGTIGHIGTTSFFPSKNLGCFGDGGALFTNDPNLARSMQMIVNHGSRIKYYHEQVGINSRLDTIQAAILSVKLKHLDRYNAARKEAAEFYNQRLEDHPEIAIPGLSGTGDHIYHQYTLRILNGRRDSLKAALNELGIPAMIYYPLALSLQDAFRDAGYRRGDFPVTEQLCSEVLSLPMHTELNPEQQDFIVESILANL